MLIGQRFGAGPTELNHIGKFPQCMLHRFYIYPYPRYNISPPDPHRSTYPHISTDPAYLPQITYPISFDVCDITVLAHLVTYLCMFKFRLVRIMVEAHGMSYNSHISLTDPRCHICFTDFTQIPHISHSHRFYIYHICSTDSTTYPRSLGNSEHTQ